MRSMTAPRRSGACIMCTPDSRYAAIHQMKLIPDHLSPLMNLSGGGLRSHGSKTHKDLVILDFNQMLSTRLHSETHLAD